MRTTALMSLQLLSLLFLVGSANSVLENTFATTVFAISFFSFAACSIYISKHQKRLLREIEREFGN